MTARDLALWDVSMIDQKVLKPASYQTMESEVRLTDGSPSRYALGLQVGPGFGASLRAEGVRLNTLTLCVIVLGPR